MTNSYSLNKKSDASTASIPVFGRIHLLIPIILGAVFLLIGTFFDMDVSRACFIGTDFIPGLVTSTILVAVSHNAIAFMCGVMIAVEYKNESHPKLMKYMMIFAAFVGTYACVLISGDYLFDKNGFYNESLIPLSYAIDTVASAFFMWLGLHLGKKNVNSDLFLILLICLIAGALISAFPPILGKEFFPRPRYREVVMQHPEFFTKWWVRFDPPHEIKDALLLQYGSSEFKSMPSGHTSPGMMCMMFLYPLQYVLPKLKKHALTFYYSLFLFTLLNGFCRIAVGAHFLSDIGVSILLSSLCTFICLEIIRKTSARKAIHPID